MSIDTNAYLIYGVQIADTHSDDLEEALSGQTVGVGYLHAGSYDREKTYLTVAFHEAELGEPSSIDLGDAYTDGDPTGRWNSMLDHAVGKVGVAQLTQPGWILIAGQN